MLAGFLLSGCRPEQAATYVGAVRPGVTDVQVGGTLVPLTGGSLACGELDALLPDGDPAMLIAVDAEEQVLALRVYPDSVAGCDVTVPTTARALPVLLGGGLLSTPEVQRELFAATAELDLAAVEAVLTQYANVSDALSLTGGLGDLAEAMAPVVAGLAATSTSELRGAAVVDPFEKLRLSVDRLTATSAELTGTVELIGNPQREYVAFAFGQDRQSVVWMRDEALPHLLVSLLMVDLWDAKQEVPFAFPLSNFANESPATLTLAADRPGLLVFDGPPTPQDLVYSMKASEATFMAGVQGTLGLLLPDMVLSTLVPDDQCLQDLLAAHTTAYSAAFADPFIDQRSIARKGLHYAFDFTREGAFGGWLTSCLDIRKVGPTLEVLGLLAEALDVVENNWQLAEIAAAQAIGPKYETRVLDLCVLAGCEPTACAWQGEGVACDAESTGGGPQTTTEIGSTYTVTLHLEANELFELLSAPGNTLPPDVTDDPDKYTLDGLRIGGYVGAVDAGIDAWGYVLVYDGDGVVTASATSRFDLDAGTATYLGEEITVNDPAALGLTVLPTPVLPVFLPEGAGVWNDAVLNAMLGGAGRAPGSLDVGWGALHEATPNRVIVEYALLTAAKPDL